MATYYGSAVSGSTNLLSGGIVPQSTSSIAHARFRVTMSTIDATLLSGDQVIVGLFKSGDRFLDIRYFTDGGGTTGAYDLGLYEATVTPSGISTSVVDQDLFVSAQITSVLLGYGSSFSVMIESGTINPIVDRGKTLWEMAALGAATYTEDPGLTFALVKTMTASQDAANKSGFRIDYVAGD